jgi:hypothetical protein
MATKKQKRTTDIKTKKQKKSTRLVILAAITLTVFGSLIFLFVTLFDSLYPPVTGKGGTAAKREKWSVTLYFSDANERFLTPEKRQIPKEKDTAGQARELVKALLQGSKTQLVNTFPAHTELQNVKIEAGGKIYVSFNKSFVKNHPKGSTSEMATIYSLTNTLTANLPDIKEVTLLVDGKELSSIGGHVDTRHPFTTNKDLLAPQGQI